MRNLLFEACECEKDPMFDAAIVTKNGIERWYPATANNANNGHSSTKFFISTAIGILCDEGKLSLDTKITSLFCEDDKPVDMDVRWNEVSIRNALQHKTGIDEIPYGVDDDNHIELIGDDFLKYVFSLKIMHNPGTFRRYSDEAYYLLSRVISAASGMNTIDFFREKIMKPLGFRQWAMACCPKGYPIGGGGFFARSDDVAKLGFTYACGGIYNGRKIVSQNYIDEAMKFDYACTRHRDSDVFVKTGAKGQMIAFSVERCVAAAWHGFSEKDGNERNNRLLDGFIAHLDYLDTLKGD